MPASCGVHLTAALAQENPALEGGSAGAEAGQADGEATFGEAAGEIAANPSLIWDKIDAWVDGFLRHLPNFVAAILLFVVFLLLASAARALFRRWAYRRGRDNLGDVLGGLIRWSVIALGALLALTIVLPSLRPGDLLAGLGIGSVAIGFAFKDILQNWLAGLLILLGRPFRIGDQIVVDGHEGTVERIDTRSTDIRTYDGRRVLIPNSEVYTGAVVVNTAYEKRRSEYDVGVGYGDRIAEARRIILDAVRGVEGVEADPAPEVLPWELAASSVSLKVFWWTHSRRADVFRVRGRVIEAIKTACDENGIDLPFETVVQLWHDQTEETDGIRGRQREGWPRPHGDGEPPRPAREVRPANGHGQTSPQLEVGPAKSVTGLPDISTRETDWGI